MPIQLLNESSLERYARHIRHHSPVPLTLKIGLDFRHRLNTTVCHTLDEFYQTERVDTTTGQDVASRVEVFLSTHPFYQDMPAPSPVSLLKVFPSTVRRYLQLQSDQKVTAEYVSVIVDSLLVRVLHYLVDTCLQAASSAPTKRRTHLHIHIRAKHIQDLLLHEGKGTCVAKNHPERTPQEPTGVPPPSDPVEKSIPAPVPHMGSQAYFHTLLAYAREQKE